MIDLSKLQSYISTGMFGMQRDKIVYIGQGIVTEYVIRINMKTIKLSYVTKDYTDEEKNFICSMIESLDYNNFLIAKGVVYSKIASV